MIRHCSKPCRPLSLAIALQAIRVSPIVLSAWYAAIHQPTSPDPVADTSAILDIISASALELLSCFDRHRYGRLLLALALAGGRAKGAGPLHQLMAAAPEVLQLLPAGMDQHSPEAEGRSVTEFPAWLLCQPDVDCWPSARSATSPAAIIDTLCAYAVCGFTGNLTWVCGAAHQLAGRWTLLSQRFPLVNRQSGESLARVGRAELAAASSASLISWMDGGGDEAQPDPTCWEVEARNMADGLWALSRLLAAVDTGAQPEMGAAASEHAKAATRQSVADAAQLLFVQLLKHATADGRGGAGVITAGDAACILAQLSGLDHLHGSGLACVDDAADFMEQYFLKL